MSNKLPYISEVPELMAEWDYEKNELMGFNPNEITAGSNKKVWWKCNKGHEWMAVIASRANGNGCPYCVGRKIIVGENDLANTYPELVNQWNTEKNSGVTPYDVSAGSDKRVWWICEKGHEWQASISNRTHNGQGCPYCSGQRVIVGENDIATLNPQLSKEWNYAKNGSLTPKDVKLHSNKKVWWICKKGHEWQAIIQSRVKGNGCPYCSAEIQTSFPEQAIFFYLGKKYTAKSRYKIDKWEIDVFLPDYKIGIEYDGIYYHNSKVSQQREAIKNKIIKANGIHLIRVKESMDQSNNDESTINYIPNYNYSTLNEAIVRLIKMLDMLTGNSFAKSIYIDIEKDSIDISNSYRQMEIKNSMESQYPDIAAEWDYERNGSLLPTSFSYGSGHRVWWKCNKGHEWQASINHRVKGNKCPICLGKKVLVGYNDLASQNPDLARQWHPLKNGTFQPTDVSVNSGKKVWWKCDYGHEWKAVIAKRTSGQGCPICSNQMVQVGINDFETQYPEIAAQWHPSKNNNLLPKNVTAGSHKKVWWICKHGHEWKASIDQRVKGSGCPVCSGRIVLAGFNDLATSNPNIARQWNYAKNSNLTLQDVSRGSDKKVWWICDKGHEWMASVNKRTNGEGCPFCSGHRVFPGFNDLETVRPDISKQWHPIKNGELTPKDVTAGSHKKVWWLCEFGHEWEAVIKSRTSGRGCPICRKKNNG